MSYTEEYSDKISKLKKLFEDADAVTIGAGAGLSAAAGFAYSGKRFHEMFHDFEAKYGFHDMYSGGFYPFDTLEEFWAYWSRYILINRYSEAPKPVYNDLYELVKSKNYFVITTNVDHCFQKSGFDKLRIFYTQGDYGLFQCSVPCHNKTYDNEKIVCQMVEKQHDMKIPSYLVPKCPVCEKPMTMNLRSDDKFVEDDGWHLACIRYEQFIKKHKDKKIIFLEIGVGMNTPAIIKYPFWQLTAQNENAYYVCINNDMAYAPDEIKKRSLCFSEDIACIIDKLKNI